ncbi:MAG: tetratricopeptide repeat protein, partial [bacterium]
ETGQVKITDFGLAKLAGGSTLTKTDTTMGTVEYMSPELANGEPVDHRTDIWSLGVVLYEMLTGQLPFKGEVDQAVIYSILTKAPTLLSSLRADIPRKLEQIVETALTKEPDERYQDIGQLLDDLIGTTNGVESGKFKTKPIKVKYPKIMPRLAYGFIAILLTFLIAGSLYLFTGNRTEINSIAVLPLVNLSDDPEQEYFTDGMTDALITELSRIRALKVISRTSVMRYKVSKKPLPKIARELGVDVVVEGTVLWDGEKVRISAQLVDATTDKHLWADNYVRELKNILTLHSEVARTIAREIKVTVTPQEQMKLSGARSVDPQAYQAYLKGRYYLSKRDAEGLKKGLSYFKEAIEKDPNYAAAYAGLADAYILTGAYAAIPTPTHAAFLKAKSVALRALEIDETLAEAHTSLALIKYRLDWDWIGAEKEFQRAIELNPAYGTAYHWYSEYLSAVKRHEEAIEQAKKALEVDPLSLIINRNLGRVYYWAREYDLAIQEYQKTLELDHNWGAGYISLGRAYVQKGMFEESINAYKKAIELAGRTSFILYQLGHAYAAAGMRE